MKSQQAQVQAQQAQAQAQAQAQSQQAIAQNNVALAQAASSAGNESGKVTLLVLTRIFSKTLSLCEQVDKAIELLTELQSICAIWFRRIRGGLQVS
jgi:regulator of protease activity HflC (stomatin/prohibitin superfamily)